MKIGTTLLQPGTKVWRYEHEFGGWCYRIRACRVGHELYEDWIAACGLPAGDDNRERRFRAALAWYVHKNNDCPVCGMEVE